ncbi:MAG TPA: precorrin-8X methylmutase [Paracoccus solventivorans]|uniref:precorrin-8X methylmutase n=1 Tax=Paracoccus solventivorans TaxID=53463 RepID=UPI002CA44F68|nr:precorrin-8X methylmutase [Paracoccus solventivorans]HMM10339.1 precorrin-8X methylmutase [Paracoccus solventivorans]
MRYQYETDGAAIYRASFATVRAEADLARFDPDEEPVAVRMIHAAGLVGLERDIRFSPGFAAAARAALAAGLPNLCGARMGREGPTKKELDEAKSFLKGSQMLALDTSSKFATALLQYQLDELGIDYIERRNGLVDAVTLEDARRVAGRVWGQGLLSVSVGRAPQASAQPAK